MGAACSTAGYCGEVVWDFNLEILGGWFWGLECSLFSSAEKGSAAD